MELSIYQVDAFADAAFTGNPAAICPLDSWLPDNVLQAIAEENNLSETAYFVANANGFHLRWFTPVHEVSLCGHATLASAWVLFNILGYPHSSIIFDSLSGPLIASRRDDLIELDFPVYPPVACDIPQAISDAFPVKPLACLKGMDYMVVFENEQDVIDAQPDMNLLKTLDLRGVIITARSREYDFVNRFFAPRYRIDEDPVTGSAYTQLIPYWSKQLGKTRLTGKQVSRRGGIVNCQLEKDRVFIAGTAIKYMEGKIFITL